MIIPVKLESNNSEKEEPIAAPVKEELKTPELAETPPQMTLEQAKQAAQEIITKTGAVLAEKIPVGEIQDITELTKKALDSAKEVVRKEIATRLPEKYKPIIKLPPILIPSALSKSISDILEGSPQTPEQIPEPIKQNEPEKNLVQPNLNPQKEKVSLAPEEVKQPETAKKYFTVETVNGHKIKLWKSGEDWLADYGIDPLGFAFPEEETNLAENERHYWLDFLIGHGENPAGDLAKQIEKIRTDGNADPERVKKMTQILDEKIKNNQFTINNLPIDQALEIGETLQ